MLARLYSSERAHVAWLGAFILVPLAVWATSAYRVSGKSLSNWVAEPFGVVTLSALTFVVWLYSARRRRAAVSVRSGIILVAVLSVLAFAVCLAVPGLPE